MRLTARQSFRPQYPPIRERTEGARVGLQAQEPTKVISVLGEQKVDDVLSFLHETQRGLREMLCPS